MNFFILKSYRQHTAADMRRVQWIKEQQNEQQQQKTKKLCDSLCWESRERF